MRSKKQTFDQAVLVGLHCNSMEFKQYQALLHMGLGVPFPKFIITSLTRPTYVSRNVDITKQKRLNISDEHYAELYNQIYKYLTTTDLKAYEIYDKLEEMGVLKFNNNTKVIPYQRVTLIITEVRKKLGIARIRPKGKLDKALIYELRENRGLTNREISRALGFSESACSTAYTVYKQKQLKLV